METPEKQTGVATRGKGRDKKGRGQRLLKRPWMVATAIRCLAQRKNRLQRRHRMLRGLGEIKGGIRHSQHSKQPQEIPTTLLPWKKKKLSQTHSQKSTKLRVTKRTA